MSTLCCLASQARVGGQSQSQLYYTAVIFQSSKQPETSKHCALRVTVVRCESLYAASLYAASHCTLRVCTLQVTVGGTDVTAVLLVMFKL